MRTRIGILVVGVIILSGVWFLYTRTHQTVTPSPYIDSTLAVRGFRHDALELAPGDSKTYTIGIGEQFKVTWKTINLSEPGQLLYHGSKGIGSGLVRVPLAVSALQSAAPFLEFTPTEAGQATFVLTTTGPLSDGIYTLTSTLTVNIK